VVRGLDLRRQDGKVGVTCSGWQFRHAINRGHAGRRTKRPFRSDGLDCDGDADHDASPGASG
jgi:hypothetical protein